MDVLPQSNFIPELTKNTELEMAIVNLQSELPTDPEVVGSREILEASKDNPEMLKEIIRMLEGELGTQLVGFTFSQRVFKKNLLSNLKAIANRYKTRPIAVAVPKDTTEVETDKLDPTLERIAHYYSSLQEKDKERKDKTTQVFLDELIKDIQRGESDEGTTSRGVTLEPGEHTLTILFSTLYQPAINVIDMIDSLPQDKKLIFEDYKSLTLSYVQELEAHMQEAFTTRGSIFENRPNEYIEVRNKVINKFPGYSRIGISPSIP